MERLLLHLALLALAFSSGNAVLKCYQCMSMTNKECADPFLSTQLNPTDCELQKVQQFGTNLANAVTSLGSKLGFDMPSGGILGPDAHWTCLKLDYLDDKGKNYTVRGCRVPDSDIPNVDFCKKSPPGMKVTFCGGCEGEGCNGAGRLGGVATFFYLLLPSVVALKAVAA